MVLSVTLNPCIDKTIYLDSLEVGAYNRVKSTRTDLAGKGLNVSTVLSGLKEETLCMGFNFRSNGAYLEQALDRRGVKYNFVNVEGAIRTNIKLVDSHMTMTEINEAGGFVPSRSIDRLIDEIEARLEHTHILVMSGSVPPGVPADIYARLIRMARRHDVKTVLDTAGEPLILGVQEKPFLLKPNRFEFEQLYPDAAGDDSALISCARKLVDSGVPYLCISMGEEGALLLDRAHAYRAKALPVEAKGLAGAGDSLVAGMCYALRKNLDTADMLRYAMAAAGGSVRQEGTLLARKADIEELLPLVEIETIE